MAAPTLSVLSSPHFHNSFDRFVTRLERLVRLQEIKAAESHLIRCDFADEHCNCRALATVHELATENEYCLRHFLAVQRGH